MWQNNISWVEGLFSEIQLRRFNIMRTNSQLDSPLAIFTRLSPNMGNDLSNLKLESIQTTTSSTNGIFDTLSSPNYYIVAIDTRIRTTILFVNFKTKDFIPGKFSATIEYQAVGLEQLFKTSDPLAMFKDKIGELFIKFVSQYDYESINKAEIKTELNRVNTQPLTGLVIRGVSGVQIQWADKITHKFQQDQLDIVDDKKNRKLNDSKIEKLYSFGIHNSILIAHVLSQPDGDFEAIMKYVRSSLSQTYKDENERDINLLHWLKEKDLMTESDVQNIVDVLSKRHDEKTDAETFIIENTKITNSAIGKNPIVTNETSKPSERPTGERDKSFRVSISFPLLLSKRFDTVFLFQLYLPESRPQANKNIRSQFREQLSTEFNKQSKVKIGQKIQIEFYSSQFNFSKPVIKSVEKSVTKIIFLGMPKDGCEIGTQNVRVSISDVQSQQEIESFNIEVRVEDFAFDHISRPLLSRISTIALGIGSFLIFLLTLLEQIDKTVGLTSGTAAGVLAAAVYANFYNLYQRIRPSSP